MRDRIERFVLLPFSLGCVSESSIAVGSEQFRNRSKGRYSNSTPTSIPEEEDEEEEEEEEYDEEQSSSEENLKSFLAAPKFQRLFKNFKNISQLFVYKDEDDENEEEEEEEEMGMEIGFPTDVKHVTHIGIDGSTTSILSKGWEDLKQPQFNIPAGASDHDHTTKAPNTMKMMMTI